MFLGQVVGEISMGHRSKQQPTSHIDQVHIVSKQYLVISTDNQLLHDVTAGCPWNLHVDVRNRKCWLENTQ